MLNISNQSQPKGFDLSVFHSGKKIANKKYYRTFNKLSILFLIMVVIILFLPWTQNISGTGSVTTLRLDQRPQTIQSTIPGRIEQWYVQEGYHVNKGDTLLRISEIKSEYFDDRLMERTAQQIEAKSLAVKAYQGKVEALKQRIVALQQEQVLKFKQTENKLQQAKLLLKTIQMDVQAAQTNLNVADTQYQRVITLQQEGLKATKDVEEKRIKFQSATAKRTAQQNKELEMQNKLLNAEIELSRLNASYQDKISKAQSELHTAQSAQFGAEAEVAKLENKLSNYVRRNELQYVTAPQTGYLNKALKGGVGVTFKEGESLLRIMPVDFELAVETYVRPIDLPLIHVGEKVRVQFDGWPAIVFSGWESVSYGTYGARVVGVENFISDNGKYRILLVPDTNDHPWPSGIRVGSGVKTIALLEDVPIWYEVWRQLNGFPPNFYKPVSSPQKSKK